MNSCLLRNQNHSEVISSLSFISSYLTTSDAIALFKKNHTFPDIIYSFRNILHIIGLIVLF